MADDRGEFLDVPTPKGSRTRETMKYTEDNGAYKCWDCGRAYLWASSLSRHRAIECGPRNKKDYVCKLCNYRSAYKANFMRHLRAPRHLLNRQYAKRIHDGTMKRVKDVDEDSKEMKDVDEDINEMKDVDEDLKEMKDVDEDSKETKDVDEDSKEMKDVDEDSKGCTGDDK